MMYTRFCSYCSVLWCLVLLVLLKNNTTLGTETATKRNQVTSTINPSQASEDSERKRRASIFCLSPVLDLKQRKMCLKFPLQVDTVFRGYREALDECQYQFRNERWNCSTLVSIRGTITQPLRTKLMTRGFKEAAFVHALVAAAVAKAVSLDCARGLISSCDRMGSKRRRAKKEYAGHDEAISHGIYFSEKFLNSEKSNHDFQGMVNRHNLRVGRTVFTNTLKTMCKCHGLSGSCTSKTCVETASGLRQIGNAIKAMYLNAKKVETENMRRGGLNLIVVDSRKSPTKSELLYTENSPSFCDRDDALGIAGVSGRVCSKDPSHENSCRTMCCGKGYDTLWLKEDTDCHCEFKYCCFVQCKKCSRLKWVTKCK